MPVKFYTPQSKKFQDLRGLKFGRLIPIATVCGDRHTRWLCKCDCGNDAIVMAENLKSGNTQSCGCLHREKITIHGLAKHGQRHYLFSTWCNMRTRCDKKDATGFKHYGGRGVKVCPRWRLFTNFLEDMEKSWKPGLSLERINNDGDYEPSNCKWATQMKQTNNTRFNHRLEFKGEIKTLTQWSRILGIKVSCIRSRLARKWSVHKALSTPPRQ